MFIVDYGVFCFFYLNKYLVMDWFWCLVQLVLYQIVVLKVEGIWIIINLCGGWEYGLWQFQKEVCDWFGIYLVEFVVCFCGVLDWEILFFVKEFFDMIEYLVVLYCKLGVDWVGFVVVFYFVVYEGKFIDEVQQQLFMCYGYFCFLKMGILDVFFDFYCCDGEVNGILFFIWIEIWYDVDDLEWNFWYGFWFYFFVDRIMCCEQVVEFVLGDCQVGFVVVGQLQVMQVGIGFCFGNESFV